MSENVAEDHAAPAGPATLSGRPAVTERPEPPRTKVSRPVVFFFTAFLVAVLVVAGLAFLRSGPKGTDVRDMEAGDCYTEVATTVDAGRVIPRGENTPCTEGAPRVVAVVALPLGAYPEADGLNQAVADNCGGEQDQIIAPTAESWAGGDRTVVCIALPDAS